jgi:hypothetical protein
VLWAFRAFWKVLATRDPERGKSAIRFSLHRSGQTVKRYIEKSVEAGNTRALAVADLKWDVEHKFISVK